MDAYRNNQINCVLDLAIIDQERLHAIKGGGSSRCEQDEYKNTHRIEWSGMVRNGQEGGRTGVVDDGKKGDRGSDLAHDRRDLFVDVLL